MIFKFEKKLLLVNRNESVANFAPVLGRSNLKEAVTCKWEPTV